MFSHAYLLSAKIGAFLNTKKPQDSSSERRSPLYSVQVDTPLEVGGSILAGVWDGGSISLPCRRSFECRFVDHRDNREVRRRGGNPGFKSKSPRRLVKVIRKSIGFWWCATVVSFLRGLALAACYCPLGRRSHLVAEDVTGILDGWVVGRIIFVLATFLAFLLFLHPRILKVTVGLVQEGETLRGSLKRKRFVLRKSLENP